jgi:FG-GAP-like repeat/FG-GAP repeat
VLLGNGDGTFQTVVTYGSGGTLVGSLTTVVAADVNGDGKPDLLVSNWDGTVVVLLGNGDGTFQTAVAYGSGANEAAGVAVGDVNGAGKPDVLVTNYCTTYTNCDGTVSALLGNCDGTFQTAVAYDSAGYEAAAVAVADVNGDGKLDLLVGARVPG